MNKAEYDKYKNKVANLDGYDICDEFDLATWQLRDKKYLLQIVLMHYFEEKEENEMLNKGIEYAKRIENDYKTRFDKAIEYIQNRIEDINNGGNEHDYRNLNEILNILQGSDTNE